MKRALIAVATVALLAACAGSASASTPSEIHWRKIDERVDVGCWHGAVIFWSEAHGDIAVLPEKDLPTSATAAAGC